LQAIALRSMLIVSEFAAQELANTVWAFAHVEMKDVPLVHSLAIEAQQKMMTFRAQDVANTVWAYAVLEIGYEPLADATACRTCVLIPGGEFVPQNLSNTVWAFAKIAVYDVPLLDAIGVALFDRLHSLDTQNLSNAL